MGTPESKTDRDLLFAFAHGIRMTIRAFGKPFDGSTVKPILRQMDQILGSPQHSLVKANDEVDWDQFRRLREIESKICAAYLKEIADAKGVPNDG